MILDHILRKPFTLATALVSVASRPCFPYDYLANLYSLRGLLYSLVQLSIPFNATYPRILRTPGSAWPLCSVSLAAYW